MPSHSYWINEPWIFATDFSGKVTSEDIDVVMRRYLGIVGNQSGYFLLDMSDAKSFPTDMFQLASIRKVVDNGNTLWFAVINPDVFTNYATRLLVRDKAKIFEDRDKAVGFLRGMVRVNTGEILSD